MATDLQLRCRLPAGRFAENFGFFGTMAAIGRTITEKVAAAASQIQETFEDDWMRYKLGRFLQLLGLCIVPTGIAGNLLDPVVVTEGAMLTILAAGGGVFLVGWMLQGKK